MPLKIIKKIKNDDGEKMELQFKKIKKKEDELKEKHVPVIEIEGNKAIVKVGSIEHPSEIGHFIQWIELREGEIVLARAILSPFISPEAEFMLKEKPEKLNARIFCNLHGTWEGYFGNHN